MNALILNAADALLMLVIQAGIGFALAWACLKDQLRGGPQALVFIVTALILVHWTLLLAGARP